MLLPVTPTQSVPFVEVAIEYVPLPTATHNPLLYATWFPLPPSLFENIKLLPSTPFHTSPSFEVAIENLSPQPTATHNSLKFTAPYAAPLPILSIELLP